VEDAKRLAEEARKAAEKKDFSKAEVLLDQAKEAADQADRAAGKVTDNELEEAGKLSSGANQEYLDGLREVFDAKRQAAELPAPPAEPEVSATPPAPDKGSRTSPLDEEVLKEASEL
jgi:alkyl sulfatase BDS1-like metallo-beta-lactamase superfamily hydrolase